ncbi:MAG: GGDEF domain-containing protein [Pseudomonadota bacterium]
MLPSAIAKQPILVRLMMGVGLMVLPAVALVDYLHGYYFAMAVELLAAASLLVLLFFIRHLSMQRAIQVALLVTFVLAAMGSLEKLDSAPNLAWFTVMPFLYVSIGGIRFGGTLTLAHFSFIAGSYFVIERPAPMEMSVGTLIQVALAYVTATGIAIGYEQVQRQLRNRLRELADVDPLTELLNRRGMERRLDELSSFLERNEMTVTLALLDIDHFKQVNDRHGHEAGDRVLKEIGGLLKQVFRDSDYLSRWGGEEFLVALTNTNVAEATAVLERLRTQTRTLTDLSVPSVTLSVGIAEWRPGMEIAPALKEADLALYEAKAAGRNMLIAAGDRTGAETVVRIEPPLTSNTASA